MRESPARTTWEFVRVYRGWIVLRWIGGPVTGQFVARRHGVQIGTSTLAGLLGMIRERERQE